MCYNVQWSRLLRKLRSKNNLQRKVDSFIFYNYCLPFKGNKTLRNTLFLRQEKLFYISFLVKLSILNETIKIDFTLKHLFDTNSYITNLTNF